jgi:hypothetical protein
MRQTFLPGLLLATAAAVAALAPAIPASAATPAEAKAACRAALDKLEALYGVCFWPEQDFEGQIAAHVDPRSEDVCGALTPKAKSVVNLTRAVRKVYAFSSCKEGNFLNDVKQDEALREFEGGHAAGSWR